MQKGALYIGFGEPKPGYRKKALKVLEEILQYWTRMLQKGEIESFEPVFLEYHGRDHAGFIMVKGDREKLNRIWMSPDFENLNHKASLVASSFGFVDAFVGEEMQRRLVDYQRQVAELD